MDPYKVETPIVIYLHTAQRWLCKLSYEYKDVHKDVFVNRHKRSDVIEDRKNFFKKIEKFKPYMVEFKENKIIKPKIYSLDCAVRRDNCCPIFVITHDECIFSANDRVRKA